MVNPPIDLTVGSKHKTRSYDDVVVIAYEGFKKVSVRFVDTGHVAIVSGREVRNGYVKDRSACSEPEDFKAGTVIKGPYGSIEIIKYTNANHVKVRFALTGSERVFTSDAIRDGRIKDLFAPSVYGVGFMGDGKFKSSANGAKSKPYSCWHSMMQRCYDSEFHKTQQSYMGCSVSKVWHNYQVFAEWFELNYPMDGGSYELDKDLKVAGNRVYSPESCMFIPKILNIKTSAEKVHTLINPDGKLVTVLNLRQFCIDNNLSVQNLYAVKSGKLKQHKGWVLTNNGLTDEAAPPKQFDTQPV